MSGYGCFAQYYDVLTENVDYPARGAYFDSIIKRESPQASLVLDLACGTGRLTYALSALGYDMIGVDASEDMLSVAMAQPVQERQVLFLCQRAEELDLYGTIDACVCALDSLNHLDGEEALRQAIGRVALFLNPGGVFVFDMNTLYKHREVLGDHVFVYEQDQVLCVWRNACMPEDDRVEITLDFFEHVGKERYVRSTEYITEHCYSSNLIQEILAEYGLSLKAAYAADTLEPPVEATERVVYVAIKDMDSERIF